METLGTIHARMLQLLGEKGGNIEGIFFCPHGPDEGCHCRKPAPGLFEELAMRAGEDLRGVPAVGDSLRDLVAAARVGALPVLVKTGKGRDTLKRLGEDPDLRQLPHIPVYKDLAAFVDELLEGGLDAEMAALGSVRSAP